MKSTTLQIASSVLLCLGLACNEEDDRFETVSKLRTIGVSASPVFPAASKVDQPSTVTLDVYAILPLGGDVKVSPYQDPSWTGVTPVTLSFTEVTEPYKDYAKLRRFLGRATFTVPPADQLLFNPNTGYAKLAYGVTLTSGSEEEKIVGSVLVYPEGREELGYYRDQPFSVAIASPNASAAVSSEVDVTAAPGSAQGGEGVKIGWFVSSGKIINRRAKETSWQEAEKGQQTIIVTARGVRSGAFSLDIRDVTVD
jgi:hypothetical protein